MTSTPKLSIAAEDSVLVVRVSMAANPILPRLWDAVQRAGGHPQLLRAGYAVLVQALARTIAEAGPDMWAEARALNDDAAKDGQP